MMRGAALRRKGGPPSCCDGQHAERSGHLQVDGAADGPWRCYLVSSGYDGNTDDPALCTFSEEMQQTRIIHTVFIPASKALLYIPRWAVGRV